MSDREGPQETASYSRNWLILFATLILVAVATLLLGLVAGQEVASVLSDFAIGAIAVFAFGDGGWRLLGNEGLLGPGWGIDRFLAFIQVLLATGALFGLLA